MKHLGTKRIETERLILRPFELTDAEAMFKNWASDPEVTKFLTWPAHQDVDVSRTVLVEWVNKYKHEDFYQWAITLKSHGDEPIGTISIVEHDDRIQKVHVGYCIGRNWWNMGITSEALDALIDFFFNEVKVNRVDSRHDPKNPNSGKVMEKCGMTYEGTIHQGDWNNQGICDFAMYGIVADNYKNRRD